MLIPRKKGSSKNMGKINDQFVGFKILALGGYSLIVIFVFLRGAANLRSVPGGKHSSYVTDVYAIKKIFIESS